MPVSELGWAVFGVFGTGNASAGSVELGEI